MTLFTLNKANTIIFFSDSQINKTYLRAFKLLKINFVSIFASGSEVTSFFCFIIAMELMPEDTEM